MALDARFLKARVRRVLDWPRTLRHRKLHETGRCSVCGRSSRFLAHSDNLKESLHCVHCNAWTRVRFLADVLVRAFAREDTSSLSELVEECAFRELAIFEAQAAGPLHLLLRSLPGYVCSEYLAGVARGSSRDGIRCEDLQALSFADQSFDLVLHSSVLEHVRRPRLALAESLRVLRPGGHTIFEVPMTERGVAGVRQRTVVRVDATGGEDVHVLEPVYHDDPLSRAGALVYTDFGVDLAQHMSALGFEVRLETLRLERSSMSHAVIVVARKPATGGAGLPA